MILVAADTAEDAAQTTVGVSDGPKVRLPEIAELECKLLIIWDKDEDN